MSMRILIIPLESQKSKLFKPINLLSSMKKILTSLLFLVLLTSFAFAKVGNGEGNDDLPPVPSLISSGANQNANVQAQVMSQIRDGNYTLENGKKAQLMLQENNRFRLKVNNVSAECEETCNLTQEQTQNRTRLFINFSNGRNSEIKIMPNTASETALARLRIRVCNETNNCTIQLKAVGKGNETRAAYEVQVQRHFKLLGMFRLKAQERAQIDAENGEVIVVKKPWWAFLASETPEEDLE